MIINSAIYPGYDVTHYSDKLQRKKTARIIIPHENIKVCRTIIYLLHPFATNRLFWANYFTNISNLPFIFVLPESGRNWLINDAQGLHYEDYFISELINDIEEHFPSVKRRIIGGFSMGGAAAFFLAFRYPTLFDITFSLAGAFNAYERTESSYQSYGRDLNLMIPTEQEHKKVWGEIGSRTRENYNLPQLNNLHHEKIRTKFIFEVGLDDYERVIDMNRKTRDFFFEREIPHIYSEFSGNHSREYAYQGLNRIIQNYIV